MIDGVKLLCNLNPTDWTNNKDLSFYSWINATTGEISRNNKNANISGLYLSIKDGETNTYCNARGSLPKYHTNGKTNAIDYTFSDFLNTCDQLEQNLKIRSKYAIMRGFEFGVNIILPFYCSIAFECVKSYKQHTYSHYTENGQTLGIVFKLQHYSIKIYDKGLQETGKKSRLMRFEIVVNKMIWVNRKKEKNRLKLDIKTLADLQSKEVWAELSKELISVWDNIIFVDNSLNYKEMNNHEQKKILCYRDTHYWANLNNKQYCLAKQHLNKLQSLYSIGEDQQQIILDLITDKCLTLLATETTAENGNELTEMQPYKNAFENPETEQRLKKQKREQFNHLDKGLNTVTIPHTFLSESNTKKARQKSISETNLKTPKKCNCMNCKKTLTEKKANAKFCGMKCKNQYNGQEQIKANQKKRQDEKKRLEKIIKNLSKTDLTLLTIYKADGMQYADQLQQREISVSNEWIRQIEKVLITDNKSEPPIEFTTLRAKKLIREIAKLNR